MATIDLPDTSGSGAMPVTTGPIPGSRRVYATGSDPLVRVPFRAIDLTNGETHTVYDTSGPYSDPDIAIDVRTGIGSRTRAVDRASR